MKILYAVLVAVSISFLITGPVHGWNGPSDDLDNDEIKNDVDLCPYEPYWHGWHESCLKSAGLKMPSYYRDDERAEENWRLFWANPDKYIREFIFHPELILEFFYPTTPNDRSYVVAELKTCENLRDWQVEMLDYALSTAEARERAKQLFDALGATLGRHPAAKAAVELIALIVELGLKERYQVFSEAANSGAMVYLALCSRNCGEPHAPHHH